MSERREPDWRGIHDALLAPFPDGEVEFLPRAAKGGRALALAHIDSRAVMRRLDAVVGPENWSFDYEVVRAEPRSVQIKGTMTVCGVSKTDAGEATTEDEPLKSAVSDAMKRCAVHWGIGRYLYYLPQIWVNYDEQKRRFTDAPHLQPQAIREALRVCGYQGTAPTEQKAAPVAERVAATTEANAAPSYAAATVPQVPPPPSEEDALSLMERATDALKAACVTAKVDPEHVAWVRKCACLALNQDVRLKDLSAADRLQVAEFITANAEACRRLKPSPAAAPAVLIDAPAPTNPGQAH